MRHSPKISAAWRSFALRFETRDGSLAHAELANCAKFVVGGTSVGRLGAQFHPENGAPGEIRTHDLCLRRAALYPGRPLRPTHWGPKAISSEGSDVALVSATSACVPVVESPTRVECRAQRPDMGPSTRTWFQSTGWSALWMERAGTGSALARSWHSRSEPVPLCRADHTGALLPRSRRGGIASPMPH